MKTQRERVLQLLADGRWHSTIEFVDLGILRCSARVHELRRRGFSVEVRRVARRGRSAVYAYRLHSNQAGFAWSSEDEPATRAQDQEPPPAMYAEPPATGDTVELPSMEERRRIAAEARAAFARSLGQEAL